jgi:hypothetical protein
MNRFRPFLGLLCGCAVAAGLAGCGGGPRRYGASGVVKWQGRPLDQGAITFLPLDPAQGSSGGALIKDGRYSIPARQGLLPGRYKVTVSSADPRKAPDPDAPPGPAGPLPKDRVKPKYNSQTELTAEVRAEGPNTFDFEVD